MELSAVIFFSIIGMSLLGGCNKTEAQNVRQARYRSISPIDAKKMMSESADFIILDVRTEDEHKEIRIAGSVLLPVSEIKNRAEKEIPDKTKLIFVHCKSGRRSASAAKELVSLGYINVYDIGGISQWPYETVSN